MVRREGPVIVPVHRIVDDEVLRENLREHALAFAPRATHSLQRVFTTRMDQVEGHAEDLGDANGRVGRLALHLGRAAQRVTLRPRVPALVHLLLQPKLQLPVLGVHRGNRAELVAPREGVHQRLVVAHDCVFVRHEVLK